jgi:hypothetical protein
MDFNFNNIDFINYTANSINLVLSILSTNFSLLIIYILIKINTKSTEFYLISILTAIELIVSLTMFAISICKFIYEANFLRTGTIQCYISSLVIVSIAKLEIITICFLALLRYSMVCQNAKLNSKVWIIAYFIVILPPSIVFGYSFVIGDANPGVSYLYCSPYLKPGELTSVMTIVVPLLYVVPCWVTTFCYFEVGRKANKNLNAMKQDAINNNDQILLKSIRLQKRKLITQLIMVFILFNVDFMLSYIGWILRFTIGFKRTAIFDACAFEAIASSFMVNPFITITFQPELNYELNLIIVKSRAKLAKFISNLIPTRN